MLWYTGFHIFIYRGLCHALLHAPSVYSPSAFGYREAFDCILPLDATQCSCTFSGRRYPHPRRCRIVLTGPAMAIPATEMTSFLSVAPVLSITTFFYDLCASLFGPSAVMIKRTYQPSIIRKRRKQGFLERQKTVGGQRVLKRRRQKGRARLGGC